MTIDWSSIAATTHPGESGTAVSRTVEWGAARVRVVKYSAGYKGDHWCERGHMTICLEGAYTIEYEGGACESIRAGDSWCANDGAPGHRIFTPSGTKLFIVD